MFESLIHFEKFIKENRTVHDAGSIVADEEINRKYQKGEIRIVTEQARYPLSQIKDLFGGSDYNIHPDFQRRLRWSIEKQSLLIESFIMNVPIPPIFLYEVDFSTYEVMDGYQRLTAIIEFYSDLFALEGLEAWPELNGRKYSELPDQIRKGIDRRYLSSIILLKETAKSDEEARRMKQMVFARINSGGALLEDQENRNALYGGPFNNLIIELARNAYFCQIFDLPEPSDNENVLENIVADDLRENPMYKKMADVETVLRFFAIRNRELWTSTFTCLLDTYLALMKDAPQDVLTDCERLFNETIELAYTIYGEHTFLLWRYNKLKKEYVWSTKPLLFLYDCIMTPLSNHLDKKNVLIAHKDEIIAGTKQVFIDHAYSFNGRNVSRNAMEERIGFFNELFGKYHA